ncbi:hypothetical protein [Citrobacter sp. Cb220]|uniref:hypothetical protein n=1 Tax=Citrobacter sp. Cb220 TaxID=2985034 RepID=UPI00257656FF|nr:hypothetical protein [Citrobacter sp. Cb220]MDM3315959.1 hypothetical protein [Citrobacter sp. Cb220]
MFKIETEKQAEEEIRKRIYYLKKAYENKQSKYIKKLINKIESCTMYEPCMSMACAQCQTARRLKYLVMWRQYFQDNKDYKLVTLIFYRDIISTKDLRTWTPGLLKERLRKILSRIGFNRPITGGFDMDYHRYTHAPKESHWMPHFHLLIPNEPKKLEKLRAYMLKDNNLYVRKGRKNRPMRIDDIDNILPVLSYCVKGFWQEIPWFVNEEGKLKKVNRKRRIKNKSVFVKSLLALDRLSESQLNFTMNVQKR